MKRAVWLGLGVLSAVVVAGCIRTYVYEYSDGTRIVTSSPNSMQVRLDVNELRDDGRGGYAGEWSTQNWHPTRSSVLVAMHEGEGSVQHMFHFASRELTAATQPAEDGAISFDLRRDAGVMSFTGTREGRRAAGDVALRFDEAYMRELAGIVGGELSAEQKFRTFRISLPLNYARAIKDAGYAVDLDSLLMLRGAGVSEDFAVGLRKAGYTFNVQQLIGLSRHGISRNYVVELREAGFDLGDEQIIKLSRYGISSSYARDMRAAGYGDVDDIIEFSRYGVSTSYARDMGLGGKRSAAGVIEMNRHGVSASFGRDLAQLGYNFSDADLVNLGRYGVSSTYAKSLYEAGYKFSAKDLVELNRHGVGSDYARRIRESGYDTSAEDLIKLSRYGVSSSFVASLHDPGKPNLPIEAIIDLNRRGVDADTVKKIRGL